MRQMIIVMKRNHNGDGNVDGDDGMSLMVMVIMGMVKVM